MTHPTTPHPVPPAADRGIAAARSAVAGGDLRGAHAMLARILEANPADAAALLLMAQIGLLAGQDRQACATLLRVVELSPDDDSGWAALVEALDRLAVADAKAIVAQQRDAHPSVERFETVETHLLEASGDYAGARERLRAVVRGDPSSTRALLALGNAERTLGHTDAAIAAYRAVVTLATDVGRAYWSLSDIKTFRFTDADVADMARSAGDPALPKVDRVPLAFARARAHELHGDHERAFRQYEVANAMQRAEVRHDPGGLNADVEASRRFLTRDVFARNAGHGCQQRDPIFIVGLPRSGSTLVEQILASHPAVEATRELADLDAIVRHIAVSPQGRGGPYQRTLAATDAAGLTALGQEYLRRTRGHRRTDRALFMDKAPGNFRHVGLIRLILPHARIIDVRRDAAGCGLSIYRQMFSRGFTFANSLEDIATYRRGYRHLMEHWDAVAPGAVHRIDLATLVTDTEAVVRGLLDYLCVPFEPACLDFHRTDRPIRTPSAEQVRQPMSVAALESWRPYERWLGPLAE